MAFQKNLTGEVRQALENSIPLEDALPTRMPVYVNSMAYLFGVSALSALGMLIFSGLTLSIFGPAWYHVSRIGHFVHSLHFWSVQAFFLVLVLHLLTKYSVAAWRDGRWRTWMAGILAFGIAVFTGLTGFLLQTNFDAQWIAVQAKDAMNALGVGAFFNTMNTGQVLTLHVVFLPALLMAVVLAHLVLIRREGPVKPFAEGRAS